MTEERIEGTDVCNLYHVVPQNSLDSYIRRHIGRLWLPEWTPLRPHIGPFDTGMFLVPDGEGGLLGAQGSGA